MLNTELKKITFSSQVFEMVLFLCVKRYILYKDSKWPVVSHNLEKKKTEQEGKPNLKGFNDKFHTKLV